MCSTVFVEPPIAMSSAIALANARSFAIERGSAVSSSSRYQRRARSTTVVPASVNSCLRAACVASVEPLPGSDSPSASVRQFIEFAVNMPEQDPHVGHAERSTSDSPSSSTSELADAAIVVIRSVGAWATPSTTTALPASIGPPDTNTVGMFSRIAALSMPGVILSQFEMHTSASAWWALVMYSTESAMISRDGSEYSIPLCPMAMPSSTAMVWNSRGTPPASRTPSATTSPRSLRWTCPGTNCVYELAIATMGLPKSLSVMPVARHRERAPAALRPWVVVRERSAGMGQRLRPPPTG